MILLQAAAPAQAPAPALPPEVKAVIEAATASGDAKAVQTVVRFAIKAHPAAEAEIQALHSAFSVKLADRKERQAAEKREQLAAATVFEEWEGSFEVGGSRSTGSANNLGLYGAVTARRAGLDWDHRLSARVEVQETNGRRTAERAQLSWQPRRQLSQRAYAFGLSHYERDPFLGFDNRYTLGVGAGYSLVDAEDLRLELEAGPAFRSTDARAMEDFSAAAARASIDLRWQLTPTLQLKQNGSLLLDEENGSGRSTTALDATVIGPVKMRLSYELRYERDILRDIRSLDTASRATLVYAF